MTNGQRAQQLIVKLLLVVFVLSALAVPIAALAQVGG
ncbi:MAG: hypothetical protein QOJ12_779 [Thermoleophilales bacterium]|jgi:hypothetical protein|nr:hypothetical protein [Thermoleophilales bacterium]